MKHFIVTLLVGFWLLGPHAFADVSAKNGISITTASTINGKTPNSAFNGLTIVSGGSGPTLVVSTSAHSVGGAGFTTPAVNTTGSDFIAVCVTWYGASARPLTDPPYNNTWIPTTDRAIGSTYSVQWYYCASPSVGAGHTFDIGGSGHYGAISVLAMTGFSSPAVDVENTDNASSWTTLNSGSVTTTVSNTVSFTGIEFDTGAGTLTVPSGYNAGPIVYDASGDNVGVAVAWKANTSTVTINPQWLSSSAYLRGVASHVAISF